MSPQIGRQLDALSIEPNNIYVYEVLRKLNALMFDIDEAEALAALVADPSTSTILPRQYGQEYGGSIGLADNDARANLVAISGIALIHATPAGYL